jgi:hypothetical protein
VDGSRRSIRGLPYRISDTDPAGSTSSTGGYTLDLSELTVDIDFYP